MTEQKSDAKKPIYKKWWFWVIIVVVLLAGIGSAGNESDDNNDNIADTSEDEQTIEQGAEEKETGKKEEEEKKEITYSENPKEWITNKVVGVVGEDDLLELNYVPDNHFTLIKFKGNESWNNKKTIERMYLEIHSILKEIAEDIDTDVDFNVVYPMMDKYGNTSDDIVMKATYKNSTIKKINFKNITFDNIPSLADEWWDVPGVRL